MSAFSPSPTKTGGRATAEAGESSPTKVQDTPWGGQVTPVKWIEVGDEFSVNPRANNLFTGVTGKFNAMCVLGNLGEGKSFLMNQLAGEEVFVTSPGAKSCTKGIDVCVIGPDERSQQLAIFDVEGQADKGDKYDLQLAVPALLISNVVFVHLICTRPPKEVALDKLALMMYASEQVADGVSCKNLFGHLHLVLRDCPNDEDECKDIIFGDEDVSSVPRPQRPNIQKRNDIRLAIRDAFTSVSVWCIPRLPAIPKNLEDVTPEYKEKLQQIKKAVTDHTSDEELFGGLPMTGPRVPILMQSLSEALMQDHPALNPPSMMQAILTKQADVIVEETLALAGPQFGLVNLPCNASSLESNVSRIVKQHIDLFWQRMEQQKIPREIMTDSKVSAPGRVRYGRISCNKAPRPSSGGSSSNPTRAVQNGVDCEKSTEARRGSGSEGQRSGKNGRTGERKGRTGGCTGERKGRTGQASGR